MIHDYNNRMNSVDHSDHMLSTYETLKSVKWYRKLMLHLVNMVVLNVFILNKKYGTQNMSHSSYHIHYLITTSLENMTCLRKNHLHLLTIQKHDSMASISSRNLSVSQILKGKLQLEDVEFATSLGNNWLIMVMNS